MQPTTLLDQISRGAIVAFVPQPASSEQAVLDTGLPRRRWYSPREVAEMLGFGVSKVKMLIATGELKSIKDGRYRRVLPEWIDEYIATRVRERDC